MKNKATEFFEQAIYFNGYTPLANPGRVSAFMPSIGAFRDTQGNQQINLAFDFLKSQSAKREDLSTQVSIYNYLTDMGVIINSMNGEEVFNKAERIKLPKSIPLTLSLGEVVSRRRSHRHFTGDKVNKEALATLLRVANGVSATVNYELDASGEVDLSVRTVASAGGLYPVELYVAVNNIAQLEQGLYRYHSQSDSLYQVAQPDCIKKLFAAMSVADDLIAYPFSNFMIYYVIRPWKSMRKYGPRGLKFSYQEVGAISQNVILAVTALGLVGVDCASYYDSEINQLLQLDGKFSSIAHMTIVGVAG